VWAFVAGGGLALYVVSGLAGKFQAIKPYAVLVRGASMLLLVGGAFMAGGAGVTAAWQERIKLKQHEIDVAVEKSKGANDKIKYIVKEKIKVIHDRQIVVRGDIKRDAAEIDAACKVSPKAIKDLNEATE
jgi:hypothetical protein